MVLNSKRDAELTQISIQEIQERIELALEIVNTDPQSALQVANEAFRLADTAYATPVRGRALFARARANYLCENFEVSMSQYLAASYLAEATGDRTLFEQCLQGISKVHFSTGNLAAALDSNHCSIQLFRTSGDELALARLLSSRGAIFGELGCFADAAECFLEALPLAQRFGDRALESHVLANIGEIKIDCGELEAGVEYLSLSIAVYKEIEAPIHLPPALTMLATAYRKLNLLPQALDAAKLAVDISIKSGQHRIVRALSALAMVHADMDDFVTAESCLINAMQIAQQKGSTLYLPEVCLNLGIVYTRMGNFNCAYASFQEGLSLADEKNRLNYTSQFHLAIAEMYRLQSDFKAGFEAQQKYIEIDGALQKQRAQNLLIAQMSRLEAERVKKEAEIQRVKMAELANSINRSEILISQLQQHADQLTEQTITDPLTGLYNRRYLFEFVHREVARTAGFSLAIADLDNFKCVNDRFGHLIGDVVLKTIARLFKTSVRNSDVVARYGGEEFVIAFPGLTLIEAIPICERIRLSVQEYDWASVHPELQITTCIGIANSTETNGVLVDINNQSVQEANVARLFLLADQRLFLAKASGKNRIV